VYRRFLGLHPGHTYRVHARLNTLESGTGGDWSFSFHAAANPRDGTEIPTDRMAGVKSSDPDTLVAEYGPHAVTSDQWVPHATESTRSAKFRGDVVLPEHSSGVLTVWFRFQGTDVPEKSVGIDSVQIEDLGPCEVKK
jgi:hypothetical protein